MKTNWFKRSLCSILAFVMVLGYVPATAFASEADGLCEHHTQHTTECGYSAAVAGHDCGHEHTDDCYDMVTECVHTHGDCGYIPSVEGHGCDCQPDENGEIIHTEDCGYVEAVTEVPCGHSCSEETGCVTKTLNCQHKHDDTCGYAEAAAETPCGFECEQCIQTSLSTSGNAPIMATFSSEAYSTDYPNTWKNTGNQAYDIAQIALTQVGYSETGTNHTKYNEWYYGYDQSAEWCAIFVSWCANQAGVSTIKKSTYAYPGDFGITASPFGSLIPQTGDIVFFENNGKLNYGDVYGYDHVGIVYSVDNTYIYTVEGNKGDKVQTRKYLVSTGAQENYPSTYIAWIGRPEYAVSDANVFPTLSISGWRQPTQIAVGSNFGLRGTISTDCGVITSVVGAIRNSNGTIISSHTDTPGTSSYDIQDGINKYLIFGNLSEGYYYIDVQATANNNGATNTQSLIYQQFVVGNPSVGLPSAPTNFTATYVDNERARLSWSPSTGATSYEVQYWSPSNNAWKSDTSYSSGTSYVSTGLKNYTSWQFRVRAVNSVGASGWTNCSYNKSSTTITGNCGINGTNLTYTLSSDGVLTIRGNGAMADYTDVSPDGTMGTPSPWYSDRGKITRIIIESGVTSIGTWAFYNCTNATSVSIPSSVTTIEDAAFFGCTRLTEVTIPNSITELGNLNFAYCTSLSSISLPDNLQAIGDVAFMGCSQLNSVSIPHSVSLIGCGSFQGCTSLASVILPDSLASVGSYAFFDCTALKAVTIPDAVMFIGDYAFGFYGETAPYSIVSGFQVTAARASEAYFYAKDSGIPCVISGTFAPVFYDTGIADKDLTVYKQDNTSSTILGTVKRGESVYPYVVSKMSDGTKWGLIIGMKNGAGSPVWGNYTAAQLADTSKEPIRGWVILSYGLGIKEISDPLSSIDYLAFSNLSYSNWSVGDTIYGKLSNKWNESVTGSAACDGLTNRKLYENIANWKVIATSQSWGAAKSSGFYAVTFQGETTEGIQTVIAYRGSTGLDKILTNDGWNDWIKNDIRFHSLHEYTGQLEDAQNYYVYSMQQINSSISAVTGHSLGGALASVVSMVSGVRAEIFNAASAYEALHKARVITDFRGTDKWNILSHVIDSDTLVGCYQDEYKVFQNRRYHYSGTSSNPGISDRHSLGAFLNYDRTNDSVYMSPYYSDSSPYLRVHPTDVDIYLGVSGYDDVTIPAGMTDKGTRYGKHYVVYGGEGDDNIQVIGRSNDVFVGGPSNSCTLIDGGSGNDAYYYTKGDGLQEIHDVSGNDIIYLQGFDPWDSVSYTKHDGFGVLQYGGKDIMYVSLGRSVLGSLKVVFSTVESSREFKLDGFLWGNISQTVMVACPVDVEILDSNGNVVQLLACGTERTVYTDYGNFYVFTDQYGESVKYFDMIDGYTFRIRGVDDGTMSISYCENEGEVFSVTDVPVTDGMVATVDGGDIPILEIDKDADGTSEESVPMDTGIPSSPDNVKVNADGLGLKVSDEVWVDGEKCIVQSDNDGLYVALPDANARTMVTYSYNNPNATDVHTKYPTGMKVWKLKQENGVYTAEYVPEFDNLLQYSGSSIRITGNKGIRMITSVNQDTRNALTGNGLAGFKLLEYGTLLAQTSKLGDNPLVLGGGDYVKSNYAYKKGVADPVFKYTNGLIQYTNVLIGFTDEQCKEDIAMRPYMKLEDENGEEFVIYGGIVYRSIGYIAYQNRNAFQPRSAAYEYVWSIIHNVYGNQYDSEYKK